MGTLFREVQQYDAKYLGVVLRKLLRCEGCGDMYELDPYQGVMNVEDVK